MKPVANINQKPDAQFAAFCRRFSALAFCVALALLLSIAWFTGQTAPLKLAGVLVFFGAIQLVFYFLTPNKTCPVENAGGKSDA